MNVSQNVKKYNVPLLGKFLVRWNRIVLGTAIPKEVLVGNNVNFAYNAIGSVIHKRTVIEDNVWIFPGVSIGKADIFEDWMHSKVEGFVIEKRCGTLFWSEDTLQGRNSADRASCHCGRQCCSDKIRSPLRNLGGAG